MIEGYVRPWLLSLLQSYLEVKEEDLKLSLWGGDLHLHNVALKVSDTMSRERERERETVCPLLIFSLSISLRHTHTLSLPLYLSLSLLLSFSMLSFSLCSTLTHIDEALSSSLSLSSLSHLLSNIHTLIITDRHFSPPLCFNDIAHGSPFTWLSHVSFLSLLPFAPHLFSLCSGRRS